MNADQPKSTFGEFMFAAIMVFDERSKQNPNTDVIDAWYGKAESIFNTAVDERVMKYIESIKLEVRVKK